jgi:hypothetical protein
MNIEGSHPLREDLFSEGDTAIWQVLPSSYRAFLRRHNGGIVDPESAEFEIMIEENRDGTKTIGTSNSLSELWSFLSYENERRPEREPRSILHEHFDRHVGEAFLPSGVLAIGRCIQNSLVCISTNRQDLGTVYYWEWYWQYPWFEEFFEDRIAAAREQFPDAETIADEESSARFRELADALNYATLVAVAPTFEDFLAALHPEGKSSDT